MDVSHSVLHVYIFDTRSVFSLNRSIIFSVPHAFARSSTMASLGVRELTPEAAMVDDLAKVCGTEKIIVLFRENTDLVSNIRYLIFSDGKLLSFCSCSIGKGSLSFCALCTDLPPLNSL